ncbi:glycosyl hydrolase family 88 domain-containing protein [Ditylenchus destructor]|uniref:Glycosyl hydrolase family 88 domain-containing protein n=1 Tax=Ditylenchus destructor TaxID=166010 RepID=A0AAD4QR38_9BILA|nr:glycosyl hydrolase family 88 domain-containing protein [Ditylenchus destructor]
MGIFRRRPDILAGQRSVGGLVEIFVLRHAIAGGGCGSSRVPDFEWGRSGMSLTLLALAAAPAARGAAQPTMPEPAAILAETRRVADWQLANRTNWATMPAAGPRVRNPRDWQQAAFWITLTDLAQRAVARGKPLLDLGGELGWRLGDKPFHADDQLIAQAWIWAAQNGAGKAAIAPAIAYFDNVLANRPGGKPRVRARPPGAQLVRLHRSLVRGERCSWPPARFSFRRSPGPQATPISRMRSSGRPPTISTMAGGSLFPRQPLLRRARRQGRKQFWSRGNGWVMGGLVRMLQAMDRKGPERSYYEKLFRDMSARLLTLQKADGYWPASLLDDDPGTPPGTSGTAFLKLRLRLGCRCGAARSRRLSASGDQGMERDHACGAARRDARLGAAGWRPADSFLAKETQFYGSGAFILAGTAMYDLARKVKR